MKDRTSTTSKYGFITIVFLVLALSCLIFLISSYNKDSDKLNSTVNNLSHANPDEEKIDSALNLLYIAENNARMYSLYNDTAYLHAYKEELQSVKNLIDSLSVSHNDNNDFGEMVADKELKTKLFLQAQSLVDSILLEKPEPHAANNIVSVRYKTPTMDTSFLASADTSAMIDIPQKKKSKGLFKRISDAIKNKQDSASIAINTTLINNYRRDSVRMNYENRLLNSKVKELQNHQSALENLKQKEKAVLDANHNLFMNLQTLLQELKKQDVKMQEKRKDVLSRNAFSLTKNLKISNNYITGFSMLLSLIILIILFVLYKNEIALKKAKVQAENYARLKSEFTATMSHEIRTPLHSIHAFADELNTQDDKHHQSEIINAIKLSSRMLLSVVNNILDFTKIEKGKFKLEYVSFNPKDVINEILSGLQIQAKQKGLALTGDIDDSADRMLKGDAFHLRQILLNTISNAIKYTNVGSVSITADTMVQPAQKMLLRIKIADTGIGVAAENIPHLFDEFSSNEHKDDIVSGSTGLGLNIVKKLVDLHKGKISVISKVNEGTEFTIEIPYDIPSENEPDKSAKNISKVSAVSGADEDSTRKLNVLLVENDKFNQKFLTQLFLKYDTTIEVSSSAEEAVNDSLNQKKYDMVLTDIGLPGMNGIELAKTIKNGNGINARTIIFGLTGFEQNREDNNNQYFDEWLIKPFKSQDLIEKIQQYFPWFGVS